MGNDSDRLLDNGSDMKKRRTGEKHNQDMTKTSVTKQLWN